MKILEKYMFDPHEYEVLEAEAYFRGRVLGWEDGMFSAHKWFAARESKIAEFLRSKGISEEIISEAFALK